MMSRPKLKQVALFTSQFSVLVGSGIPLHEALEHLSKDPDLALAHVAENLCHRVEGGERLSQALARHPDVFSPIYVGLVMTGEETGALSAVLDRLAANLEQKRQTARKLVSMLAYPVFLTVVCLALLVALGVAGGGLKKVAVGNEEKKALVVEGNRFLVGLHPVP